MKKTLEPLEENIEKLKTQLQDVNDEYTSQSSDLNELEHHTEEKDSKISQLKNDITAENKLISEKNALINNFTTDLHNYYKSYDTKKQIEYMKVL